MKQSRREFLSSSAAAGIILASDPRFILRNSTLAGEQSSMKDELWYNKMRRCAQHNLNEYDPVNLDVEVVALYTK